MTNMQSNKDVVQALRTVHQNQAQLNMMADQKANILIGTLVLLFTVVLTQLLKFEPLSTQQLIPFVVLLVFELMALVMTTLVLIPKNITGLINSDIRHMPNPFFFGFFTRYSEQEYQSYLAEVLVDDDSAHRLLITDIYQIGVILKRKYSLLRWAYLFSLAGVALAILTWFLLSISA